MTLSLRSCLIFALLLTAQISAAHAHSSEGIAGGLASGFLHPILGFDHLVAMVAVGLWGAFLGMPLPVWIMLALTAVFVVVTKRTRFGRAPSSPRRFFLSASYSW